MPPRRALPSPLFEGADAKICVSNLKCGASAADSPSIAKGPTPVTGVAPDPRSNR